jgi:sulfonate transport system ATP-binding protein
VIFQEHRLFPWLTVGGNLGVALSGARNHIRDRVRFYLEKVDLLDFEKAYPGQLSGGMAQRVAIARALISQPRVLLLDEPFGALDALTRVRMQEEIERIWLAEGTTMLLITHDIEEAIFLSDRVVVLSPRPAEVNTIIPVTLKRSRDRKSPEFAAIRKMVEGAFSETSGSYVI